MEFKKYPKIPHLDECSEILDNPIDVYEKIDGGNCQIRLIDGFKMCGNRSKYLVKESQFSLKWFKNFKDFVMSNSSFDNLLKSYVIFGEWTSKHTFNYLGEYTDRFFLIDLFDIGKQRFIDYEEAREILNYLEIKDVISLPRLSHGKITKKDLEKIVERSYFRDGIMEGVVIKDYPNQKFAKLWTINTKGFKNIGNYEIRKILYNVIDEVNNMGMSKDEIVARVKRELGKKSGLSKMQIRNIIF